MRNNLWEIQHGLYQDIRHQIERPMKTADMAAEIKDRIAEIDAICFAYAHEIEAISRTIDLEAAE